MPTKGYRTLRERDEQRARAPSLPRTEPFHQTLAEQEHMIRLLLGSVSALTSLVHTHKARADALEAELAQVRREMPTPSGLDGGFVP